MILDAIEKAGFIKITRGIINKTNEGGMVDVLDCINYMRKHKIKTSKQAIEHYKNLIKK